MVRMESRSPRTTSRDPLGGADCQKSGGLLVSGCGQAAGDQTVSAPATAIAEHATRAVADAVAVILASRS